MKKEIKAEKLIQGLAAVQLLRGLKTVRVSKEFLVDKLQINRKEHERLFEEALEGWHIEVVKTLNEQLKKAKADKLYDPRRYLPIPQSHVREYDQVIDLLQASLDTEFELNATEFNQYVRDDWSWKETFVTTVSGYANNLR